MAPASNEEQFKFLISCIRYSNNGKVDFGQVAQECKIVSKGAAAKRYERMMRAHGIASNAASVKTQPPLRTKHERRESTTANANVSKKRKAEQFAEDYDTSVDEEEGFAPSIKTDPVDEKVQFRVKEEDGQLSLSEAANLMHFYDAQPFTDSQFNVGEGPDYGRSDYNANPAGYHAPLSDPHSLQAPYDFVTPYVSDGMARSSINNALPMPAGLPYQSPYQQCPPYTQGGSDSPLIVE